MTVVAVWYEKYDDYLWAVADTRISVSYEQGLIKTTDRGAKLFALPVVCSAFSENGSVERILLLNHLRFCFCRRRFVCDYYICDGRNASSGINYVWHKNSAVIE